MRASVANSFFDFSAKREGFTPFMYADTLNLVTTGIGNLIDGGPRNGFVVSPEVMAKALALPWKHKAAGWSPKNPITDNVPASTGEIVDAWTTTKLQAQKDPGFNTRSSGFAYQNLTNLSLDMQGLKALFDRTLANFNATLVSEYPTFESAPADAQQALLSMSWAMGPAFWPALRPRPKEPVGPGNIPFFQGFKDAFDKMDFAKAAELSFFSGGGGTRTARTGRNAENVIMFRNADAVMKGGGDPNRLFFPGAVSPTPGGGLASALTPSGLPTAAKVGLGAGIGFGLYKLGKWWLEK